MAIPNSYAGLLTEIPIWCNRSPNDNVFLAEVPNFITLAEKQLNFELRNLELIKISTVYFQNQNPIVDKPISWKNTINLFIIDNENNNLVFEKRAYENVLMLYQNQKQTQNIELKSLTLAYADLNYKQLIISFIPNMNYTGNIFYYSDPTPIYLNQQGTNQYSDYFFNILFFLSLSYAYMYLNNYEMVSFYENKYMQLLKRVKELDHERLFDRNCNLIGGNNEQD